MVELLENPSSTAEDLGDRLLGPREIDASGVDHRRERMAGPKMVVNVAERHGPGDRCTETESFTGCGDGRPVLNLGGLEGGASIGASRSSLATRNSTGTTPSRIRRWAR